MKASEATLRRMIRGPINRSNRCKNACVAAIFLLTVCLAGDVALAAADWREPHARAVALARTGEVHQALAQLIALQERYPDAAPLLFDRAVLLHWAGRDPEATAWYEAKIRHRHDAPAYVRETMANAYIRQNNFAAARPIIGDLAATGERRFRLLEAELLIRLDDPAAAQKIYASLLAESPQDPDLYLASGRARLNHGDNRRAAEDFEMAANMAAKAGQLVKRQEAEGLLAAACLRSNDAARAIVLLKPYIQSRQADSPMQADYVFALRANSNFEQAIAEARQLWPDWSKAPAFGLRAVADSFFRLGRYSEAISLYEQVIRREPKNHSARLGLAMSGVQTGRVAAALQQYEQVLAIDARFAELVLDDCLYYVAQGRLWTARRVFGLINAKIPANAAFYRQYADKLQLSGLPREAYRNYEILRGLPGGETAGKAGMAGSAAGTGDYDRARSLLDSLDHQQLRTPAAAQALREYEEREKGSWRSGLAFYRDYKGKETVSATADFSVNLGGSVNILGQSQRMHLRDTDTGAAATYWTHAIGATWRGLHHSLTVWGDFRNVANLNGSRVEWTWHPDDLTSLTLYSGSAPVDEVGAFRDRIMTRTTGGRYSWQTFSPGADPRGQRIRNIYTVGYAAGSLTDGNKRSAQSFNWDRVLRDDEHKKVMLSAYFSRSRYKFTAAGYDSPNLRQTVGLGMSWRNYVRRGYWEWQTFLEYGGDSPSPWDFSPYARLEYGHYFTRLFYLTAGCEYGLSTRNTRGSPGLDFGKFQCDMNLNLSW